MWEDVGHAQIVVSIIFYIVAMGGVLISFVALYANRDNQREANARRAYLDLARLGIEYPEFAFPRSTQMNYEEQTINGNKRDFERYEWFMSITIGTVRFFLESSPRHDMWRKMMILQLAYHWEYLSRYRHEKEYLKQWGVTPKDEFDEAIMLGRRLYPLTNRGHH